jgi:hypothetical protein
MMFHLGCDYTWDEHSVLCISLTKYIHKVIDAYKQMFGCSPPHNLLSPLERGDHPEIDTSKLLDQRRNGTLSVIDRFPSVGCVLRSYGHSHSSDDYVVIMSSSSSSWALGAHQMHHGLCF